MLPQRLNAVFAAGGISPARVREAAFQSLNLARGSSTVLRGERDAVLLVLVGASKLVAHVSPDREQILSFHFDGDMIFAPAGGNHVFTVAALDDSELLVFDAADLLTLTPSEPQLARFLCDRALRSLGRSREKAIALGRKTAPERVADFLLSMAARIGSQGKGEEILTLPMSRRDIADSLGLTIETVSRQFGELRKAGVIETSGRSQVRILDPCGLRARSGRSAPAN